MPPRLYAVDEEQPLLVAAATAAAGEQLPMMPSYETVDTIQHPPANAEAKYEDDINSSSSKTLFSKGHVLLFIVAILYGTLNVCLRGIYALPSPPSASALSTIRGWLAVLCFAPLVLGRKKGSGSIAKTTTTGTTTSTNNQSTLQLWRVAAELALWNFGAQALINVGLLYIESARASFLTQLSVVMTPCLAALCGHSVERNVWFACAFALAGLVIMSKRHVDGIDHGDHGHGQAELQQDISTAAFALGLGDVLCLCGALSWSTYLFRLSAVGHLYDEIQLQAIKTLLLAVLYSIWCGVEATVRHGESLWVGWTSLAAWGLLFYSALGPGTVADVLQQQGQSHVTATVANIILSLEPVFTALFGRILLGELTTGMEKVGGCLILTAAVVATLKK